MKIIYKFLLILIFLIGGLAYISATYPSIDSDTLLYYNFSNDNTFALDATTFYNNGTGVSTTTELSRRGYAMNFTGNFGSYLNSTRKILFNNESGLTVMMWIFSSGTIEKPIFRIGDYDVNGFNIVEGGGDLYAQSHTAPYNAVIASGAISNNRWVHLTVTYNTTDNNFSIYANGTLMASGTVNNLDNSDDYPLFSYDELLGEGAWNGSMDEIWIINRTLSTSEVSEIYSNYTDGNLSECGNLNEGSRTYKLLNSVTSTSTCFNILANSITLDLDDNSIIGSSGTTGINIPGYNSTTIQNGTISGFTNGIYSSYSQDDIFDNLNSSNNDYGIYLDSWNYRTNITNSKFNANSAGGLYAETINDSFINTCDFVSNTRGFQAVESGNMIINNTNISLNSQYGLFFFSNDKYNIISDSFFGYNTLAGIWVQSTSNYNNFTDSKISTSGSYDVAFVSLSNNNTLLNVTYNIAKELVSNAYIERKWYLNLQVNDTSNNPINKANVTIYDVLGNFISSNLTSTSGSIIRKEIIEYSSNGTRNYKNLHTINASKTGYTTNSSTLNISENLYYEITLVPSIIVNIDEPQPIAYAYNESLDLNYTITNYTTISRCWYYILNSTNGYEITNTTLTNCNNITFNISHSDTYSLHVFSNETKGEIGNDSVTFSVSLDSPAVVLNYPTNNQIFNYTTIFFNYTATDSNGLGECQLWGNWTGNWLKNYTWYEPTNATMNDTNVTITDTGAIWNILCNDTVGNEAFALNNLTFTVDTITPSFKINTLSTTAGSQTISFNTTMIDSNPGTCYYSIYNSSGGVDGLYNNLSVSCLGVQTTATVSEYATFNLFIYGNDTSGHFNYTNQTFTVVAGGGPGGGGGETLVEVEVPSNRTYCGDGICQNEQYGFPNGNDDGVMESFFNCAQDCEGFNVDRAFFYCVDNDPETVCIFDETTGKYVLLSVGLLAAMFAFSTVKDKSGKQIKLWKYSLNQVKNYKYIRR